LSYPKCIASDDAHAVRETGFSAVYRANLLARIHETPSRILSVMPAFQQLHILIGTMTGNAESVAQTIAIACTDQIASIQTTRMDSLASDIFSDPHTLYLICTSTHGSGDVPNNAIPLYISLDEQPRDLSKIRYGVMALGDLGSYPNTFAGGGKLFDERLAGLGAKRIGEVFTHDASSGLMAEEEGLAWCKAWLALALA
jgi:MioC protein